MTSPAAASKPQTSPSPNTPAFAGVFLFVPLSDADWLGHLLVHMPAKGLALAFAGFGVYSVACPDQARLALDKTWIPKEKVTRLFCLPLCWPYFAWGRRRMP